MLTAGLRHAVLTAAREAGYPAGHPAAGYPAGAGYAPAAGHPTASDPVLRGGGAPGRYTASLPLRIAAATGRPATPIAEAIAAQLAAVPWIAAATAAPQGYLTITVTEDALGRLAVQVTEAGPACARSDALQGITVAPPAAPRDSPWARAHAEVLIQVTAALAAAAGALVPDDLYVERSLPPPGPPPSPDPVAEAVAFAGADAIRYMLARTPPGHSVPPDPAAAARHIEANPAYAVQYAYSCAASTLRWAADLGLSRGPAAGFRPGSLAHPRERALLDALSWLPEQVARAARRGRPHEFTAFLEELAETYQVCRVACPAWPEREPVVRARLWLTGAAAAGLAAGLGLAGVSAPGRL